MGHPDVRSQQVPEWVTSLFLNASLLWWLPLALLPLVIHLLNRLRRKNIEWGAMRFLLRSHATRNKRILLEEIALLTVRIAALAALVLAATRPFVRNPYFGGKGRNRQDVAIVLDSSLSMALRRENRTCFEQAVSAAGEILDTLSDGDTVSILAAGATIRPLSARPEFLSGQTRAALKQHLANLTPAPGRLDMIRALDAAQNALASGRYSHRQIVVITNGHAQGWRLEEPRRWQFLRQTMRSLAARPKVHVLIVGGTTGRVANASLTRIELDRRIVGTDLPVEVRVTVANTGTEPVADRSVELFINDRRVTEQDVGRLTPQASNTLRFSHQFGRPGSYLIRARLTGEDQIALDDGGYFASQVYDRLPILLVDGSPAPHPLDSGTGYLEAALAPTEVEGEPRVDYLADAKRIELSDTEQADPRDYKVVVLANVPRLGERFTDRLRQFVREGGGLLIALGEQTDADWYNSHLYAAGNGLLPLRLRQVVGSATTRQSGHTLAPTPVEHPAVGLAADRAKTDIDRVRVFRWFGLAPPTEGGGQAIFRLTNGDPFLVEKRLGRGRVLLMTTPLNAEWTNLPATKVYVVMVHEMIHWLAQPTLSEWNVDAGQPMVARFDAKRAPPTARITDPAGGVHDVAGQLEGLVAAFSFSQTDMPGVYRLTLTAVDQDGPYCFVSRPPLAEHALEPLADQARLELSDQADIRFVEDVGSVRRQLQIDVVGSEIWQVLAAMVLVLLLAEVFLTRRIAAGRHGQYTHGVAFGQG
jgi:hypothetical protein